MNTTFSRKFNPFAVMGSGMRYLKYLGRRGIVGWAVILALVSMATASEARPRVGLVLCGGGAKGFAHLGTLKLIDELGIPIDCVVGTSIGGIVGALYSIGYSGWDIERIARKIEWDALFDDRPTRDQVPFFQKKDDGRFQFDFRLERFIPQTPSGLTYGQKISLLFSSLTFPYESIDDFDDLPIPFRCVAADLVTGKQIVLGRGSLAMAMRATMAIPSFFSPVEWGEHLLIDGGVLNNLPVDVARSMGADIIIAVDLGTPLRERDKLTSADVILRQTITLVEADQKKNNRENSDVLIHPDLEGMGVMDFFSPEKMEEIKKRGDEAARKARPRLVDLKRRLGLIDEEETTADPETIRTIHSMRITGHTVTPFRTIYREIDIKPGEPYDSEQIRSRLADARAGLNLERLDHEAIPVNREGVRLLIHVRERATPILEELIIEGNWNLPDGFIRRLIGYRPGDPMETEALHQRIMSLYALGYFENIHYDIIPLEDKRINLRLYVRELPRSRLRVGVHYDAFHRVVATGGIFADNLFFPGLRLESEVQLGGRTELGMKASYPSRALNLPIYPYLRLGYRSYPAEIFNGSGTRLVSYHDRSWIAETGLGFLFEKWFNAEIGYRMEAMDASPKVAPEQGGLTPAWKDRLHLLRIGLVMDTRDDVLMPLEGFLLDAGFEGSYSELSSEVPYKRLEFRCSLYQTFEERHTFRLMGYWAEADQKLPLYRSFNMGRPEYFVGMDYDQLRAQRMKIIRLDYRYRINSFLHAELIGNLAFDVEQRLLSEFIRPGRLWGVGAGLLVDTPVGPLQFITSTGSRSLRDPGAAQNEFYIVLGVRF